MFNFNHGILGINARNLLYIKPHNKRKDILFADNKLKTKHFLSARGVSVPKLYGVIRNKEELEKFDFSSLPNRFVLKPNLGSGGDGIIPIIKSDIHNWKTTSGRQLSLDEIKQHIIDILDGRYSVNQNLDSAFFEQLIITHDTLKPYTYRGLPDIRVVVFNQMPVMAMLRLPTRESEGKANLHQGAIGVGIDLAKGQTTYICYKDRIVPEIPELGPIKITIPFWDQILEIAVQTQLVANLGFLAADIAIDQTVGPVLLELNARAGLRVQIANKAGLRKRLERVKGLKINSVKKGIRIAKDMFGNVAEKTISNLSGKTVIGNEETIEVLANPSFKTLAQVSLSQEQTTINQDFFDKLGEDAPKKLKFIIASKRVTTTYKVDEQQEPAIIIGKRALIDFLIDPGKTHKTKSLTASEKKLVKGTKFFVSKINFHESDQTLMKIERQIKLVSRVTPNNLTEEIEKFKQDKTYNPQFTYKIPELDFPKLYEILEEVRTDDSPLGQIFAGKKTELFNRLELISRVGSSEFTDASALNFPKPNQSDYDQAYKYINELPQINYKNLDNNLDSEFVRQHFLEVLKSYGLTEWQVKIRKTMTGNCSVSKGKSIFIKETAKFNRPYLERLVAHEIETHVLTNENGDLQPYQIFRVGTKDYLLTQEGLAMYNESHVANVPAMSRGNIGLLATYLASKYSFAETYDKTIELGYPEHIALKSTIKVKRGLEDTSKPGCFTKNAVYYFGTKQLLEYIENGGQLIDLYIGKIHIDQLELIKQIPSLVKPIYFPKWYERP